MARQKIRVLCVDDSALIRGLLKQIINEQGDMEVVAVAPDPIVARDLIKQHNPDVLTLDVEMPRMDGLDFLERLMRLRPMPVVMVSSLTQNGSEVTLRALELGAVDFVGKPEMGVRSGMLSYGEQIADKIRAAAKSRPPRRHKADTVRTKAPMLSEPFISSEKIIALGASTGGPEAIRQVLEPLPYNSPAIVIAQHMPPGFTNSFAKRLDSLCNIAVKEAEDGERILPGHVYIAPGDYHLRLSRSGANYVAQLDSGSRVNRHRPSVDALFYSVAEQAGRNAIGVILTGMGKDGAVGLQAMRTAGAATIAQDENSSLVYGMPREAAAIGAATEVLPLADVAARMLALASAAGRAQRV